MKPLTIYLVHTSLDGMGEGYEAFDTLSKAINQARISSQALRRQYIVKETDLPRRDPTCHLNLVWGPDEDNSVSVIEIPLRA